MRAGDGHAHRQPSKKPGRGCSRSTSRATDVDGDNVLYKVVGVRDKVRVLLVAHPFAGQNVTDAGDWFVRKALVPFDAEKDKEKIDRYFIETESIAPNEVGPDKLANKDICYLLNAAARTDNPLEGLPPAFVDRLTEFVQKGGGLVIGCGDAVNKDAYNRVLGGAGLLPLPLGDVRNTTEAALFVPSADSIEENSVLRADSSRSASGWSGAKLLAACSRWTSRPRRRPAPAC